MEIVVRGWRRDHGAKEIAYGDLRTAVYDEDVRSHDPEKTYIKKLNPRRQDAESGVGPSERDSNQPRVRVSMSGEINLNGTYQVLLYLTKREIAELFQLSHDGDSLEDVAITLSKIREKRRR
jgi:hypothetical protein